MDVQRPCTPTGGGEHLRTPFLESQDGGVKSLCGVPWECPPPLSLREERPGLAVHRFTSRGEEVNRLRSNQALRGPLFSSPDLPRRERGLGPLGSWEWGSPGQAEASVPPKTACSGDRRASRTAWQDPGVCLAAQGAWHGAQLLPEYSLGQGARHFVEGQTCFPLTGLCPSGLSPPAPRPCRASC